MLRQRHNSLLVSKMELDCQTCYGGKIILDIEGNAACENCGVEVPPLEYQETLAVSEVILITIKRYHISHIERSIWLRLTYWLIP